MKLIVLLVGVAFAFQDNGLARTPQMGWNTFNRFGCDISEDTVVGAAKAMVSSGLDKLGYQYVVIDDCWQAPSRDSNGVPVADPGRFPSGIASVAQQVHDLGLKMGIYSNAGKFTCAGRFGSLGHETTDANTYASWGVDYLKYDNCYNEGQAGTPALSYARFQVMSNALNATGRPILYSLSNWGEDQPWNWATTIANSWRISGDIMDNFDRFDDRCPCTSALDCKLPGFHCAMSRIIDFAAPLGQKAGAGGWNDLDMLEVGNGGMTNDEYITHFTMWSILKSPLIMGNDVENMSNETISILTNDALIAINQDSNASPAIRTLKTSLSGGGDISLWFGNLVNNAVVIAILNTSPSSQTLSSLSLTQFFVDSPSSASNTWRVFDLWGPGDASNAGSTGSSKWGKDLGLTSNGMLPEGAGTVVAHGVRVFKLVPGS